MPHWLWILAQIVLWLGAAWCVLCLGGFAFLLCHFASTGPPEPHRR